MKLSDLRPRAPMLLALAALSAAIFSIAVNYGAVPARIRPATQAVPAAPHLYGAVKQVQYTPVNLATDVTGILPAGNAPPLPLTRMFSLADVASLLTTTGNVWAAGSSTVGTRFTVSGTASVSLTGVRMWASWAGGGARSLKARVCHCTNNTCSAATSLTTTTASVTSGTTSTITLGAAQTLAPDEWGYTVSIWDTSVTKVQAGATCPGAWAGVSVACPRSDTVMPPLYTSDPSVGKVVFAATQMELFNADGCVTTLDANIFGVSFYPIEPVIQ